MTFDYENIAKRYNKDIAEVQTKVDAYAAKINGELKDIIPADKLTAKVEEVVLKNINSLFKLSGLAYAKEQAEKGTLNTMNVIVLGVSPSEDRNSYAKWQARQEYAKDPNKGRDVYCKVEVKQDGYEKLIPLYSDKQKKDRDGNIIDNPDFGKEIPTALKVNVPLIIAAENGKAIEPKFVMGSMSWDRDCVNDIDVGKKSTVYGRINGEYFTISKDAYEGNELYQKSFDVAMRVMPDTEYWMDLAQLDSTPVVDPDTGKNVYTKFAAKGYLTQKVGIVEAKRYNGEKYLKASIRVGDSDVVNGLKMNTSNQTIVAYITDNLVQGDDVIVFGCKKSFDKKDDNGAFILDENKQRVKVAYYELWGVVKAFSSENDEVNARLRAAGLI